MRVSWRRPAADWPSPARRPDRLRPRRVKRERGGGWGPGEFQGCGVPGLAPGEAGCSPGLATADPLAGAVLEPLAFPDGHLVLQRVDEHPAGLERLPAVRAG